MSEMSRSTNKLTDRINKYLDRKRDDGQEPNPDYIEMYKRMDEQKLEQESDPEWQKNNLEYDLRSTLWILEKVRNRESYAQNLYAALCNNDFQKRDVLPILQDKFWSCSWRYAGGIVADMREDGDYMDWYCTGINDGATMYNNGFVAESIVTEEIEADLLKLGWNVVESGKQDS